MTYSYCAGNPISKVDVDGRDFIISIRKSEQTGKLKHTDLYYQVGPFMSSNRGDDFHETRSWNRFTFGDDGVSIKENVSCRHVNISKVQEVLKRQGVRID